MLLTVAYPVAAWRVAPDRHPSRSDMHVRWQSSIDGRTSLLQPTLSATAHASPLVEVADPPTLPELDLSANVVGLKLQLKARGLKVSGKKAELIERLRSHAELSSQDDADLPSQAEAKELVVASASGDIAEIVDELELEADDEENSLWAKFVEEGKWDTDDGLEPDWTEFISMDFGEVVEPKGLSGARRRRSSIGIPEKRALSKEAMARIGCYGCGADLQCCEPAAAGYVEEERYVEKAARRQLRILLCNRCRAMAHGNILPAVVEGRLRSASNSNETSAYLGVGVTTPDQLRTELKPIRDQKVLAVLLVDVTDITGSFLPQIRDLIGRNPIMLIGTKSDLLPKDTVQEHFLEWMVQTLSQFIQVIDAHLVSAKTDAGMHDAMRAIMRDRRGRDVFVLGAANCGKSLFIGSFLEHSEEGRPTKLPISSSTPGTTLKLIPLDVFDGKRMLFDTPGLHLSHRLTASLLPEELKSMIPRGRIKPYTPRPETGLEGCSFFWGGLVRVDVRKAPLSARLTFVSAAGNLRVTQLCEGGVQGAADYYAAEVGRTLTPPLTQESAKDLGELEMRKRVEIDLHENEQECDISISGLGFISVGSVSSLRKGEMFTMIDVWVPKEVKVSLRPPMPVGGLPNQVEYLPDDPIQDSEMDIDETEAMETED